MKIQKTQKYVLGLIMIAALIIVAPPVWSIGFTDEFRPQDCTWSSKGQQNPYFSLQPGYRLVIEGEEDGEDVAQRITVLRETQRITFDAPNGETITLRARVIEEYETEDGELTEISRNFYARCVETSDIYYFGEEVDIYEDGELVSHEGAWLAGENGAIPGIFMPGTFLLGAKYFNEVAPGVALDRTKNIAMGLYVTVPVGSFSHCVATKETSPLDPGIGGIKLYCPGVGLVMDEVLELVEIDTI
jgi:hypothetical protein